MLIIFFEPGINIRHSSTIILKDADFSSLATLLRAHVDVPSTDLIGLIWIAMRIKAVKLKFVDLLRKDKLPYLLFTYKGIVLLKRLILGYVYKNHKIRLQIIVSCRYIGLGNGYIPTTSPEVIPQQYLLV